jgi:hypothetical protein
MGAGTVRLSGPTILRKSALFDILQGGLLLRFHTLVLACLLLTGCGQQLAPKASIEGGESAKKKVLKMNDEHQEKLEQLTLPGSE